MNLVVTGVVTLLLAGQFDAPDLLVGTQPGELNTPLAHNGTCQTCHRSNDDPNMSMNAYRGTMMDLAGVDPIFLASLEIAYNDYQPAAALCIRCHFPKGYLAGRGDGPPEDYFGLEEADLIGINCDFCHRMQVPPPNPGHTDVQPPPALSGVKISNSQVFVNDAQTKFGPLGSELVIGHNSVQSDLFGDSVLCAQCHDVSNTFLERVDPDGNCQGFGMPVPIERTYTEWKSSDYAVPGSPAFKGCTDCHMPDYDGRAATPGNAPQREGLSLHTMVGGNTVAPRMVAWLYNQPQMPDYFQNLGPDAERIAAAAEENLRDAAELEAMELKVNANGPYLTVRVTNLTGHKLPTGYAEGRRMFLGHEVEWADGSPGFKTGVPNPSNQDFVAGQDPLKTYEIFLAAEPGEHSFHFVTVDKLIKDNRIPPLGFRPLPDTAPVGADYAENPDGTLVNWDETDFPLGQNDCWPAIVTTRLWFQGTSGEYFRFLRDTAPIFGPELGEAWEAVGGGMPSLMNEITVAVHADGTIEPAAGPYDCEAAPVYVPPQEPDPTPDPEPTPQPDVNPQPDVTPQPDVNPEPDMGGFDLVCTCTTSEGDRAPATLLGVLVLGLLVRRRRR